MSSFPCLVRFVSGSGQVRYRLGDRLVDRYLEFVAGRCRPNTLRAVAFDLKTFFTVVRKDPVAVAAADPEEGQDQRGQHQQPRLDPRHLYLPGQHPGHGGADQQNVGDGASVHDPLPGRRPQVLDADVMTAPRYVIAGSRPAGYWRASLSGVATGRCRGAAGWLTARTRRTRSDRFA